MTYDEALDVERRRLGLVPVVHAPVGRRVVVDLVDGRVVRGHVRPDGYVCGAQEQVWWGVEIGEAEADRRARDRQVDP